MRVVAHFCLLLACLWGINGALMAQPDLAKIQRQLKQAPDNKAKVVLLIDASREVDAAHPKAALSLANEALRLSQKLRFPEGVVRAYSNLGVVYLNQDQYSLSRSNLSKAINLKQQLLESGGNLNSSIASDYRLIGICYEKQNNVSQALANYQQGLNYAQKAKDKAAIAILENSIGEAHLKLNNYQEAHRSFSLALKPSKELGLQTLVLRIEKNMSTSYALLQNYLESQSYQMQLDQFQSQIVDVRDSLTIEQETKEVVVSERNLLQLEKARKEAELKAKEAELDAQRKKFLAEQERQQKFLAMGVGGGSVLVLIIFGLFLRGRARRKAKEETDRLLLNILPSEIAEELKVRKRVQPRYHQEVSILFTDFKGFTAIASHMTPEELVEKLNYAFEKFDEIAGKYHLEKIKTIGDAYMAVGGLKNEPGRNHALDTVQAAMEMQEFMDVWIGRQRRKGEDVWELRIGINTGPVVAGVIGKKKFAYDIWGDSVNLASRMETYGAPGKVNISEETFEQVKPAVRVEPMRSVQVKNRGEVGMYFVQEVSSAGQAQPVAVVDPRMRGRMRRR